MPKQNFGLGRGLGSLIPNNTTSSGASSPKKATPQKQVSENEVGNAPIDLKVANSTITELPVDEIVSNRHQPRKHFVPEQLEELSKSIREHGIIQPLVVVPTEDGEYELIAGERRLRASKMA
ncbi:ParB/RepB/Spo0J family partition protein, partial [Thalassobaculum salexigens]|uniref:ParB N-terminal domain-containing protein n=1 Tax=Thalassobaculum salexigens TaxID=455360 RepID=UPI00248EABE9